ncbi:hypothetical protein [Arenibacterium sp. LLYu02]|uniref:hypothetical protein n=1 Tax=Arenibacterium sp. LLYu02 TaxID=3404132 RepID=UPI003B223499
MPMEAEELAELKSLIAVARKRTLSFAICLGKKPEGAVFLIDRKKKPEILHRTAKKQGETPKLCSGEVTVKGNIISLQCVEAPPAGVMKHMKEFMGKTAGLPMKFLLLDASGAVLEAEDGDAEAFAAMPSEAEADVGAEPDAAPDAQGDAAPSDAMAEKLRKALAVLTRQIGGITDAAIAAKLHPVAAHVDGQIEAGDFAKATAGLKALQAALAKVGAAAAPEAPAAAESDPKWDKLRSILEPQVAEALKANHPEAGKIRAVWSFALEKADAGAFAAALQAGARLAAMVKPQAAAAPEEAQDGAPASEAPPVNAKALAMARLKWIETKRQMKSGLDTFHAAVVSQADGDSDKADIAAAASALIAQFEAFDDTLQDMLDNVVNTPDGAQRDGFKAVADRSIKDYQRVLDTPFFRMIDDNPFTKVAVTSTAKRSLELVSAALN